MNLRYIIKDGEKVLQHEMILYHQEGGYISSTEIIKGISCTNITNEWQDVPIELTESEEDE